MPSYQNKRIFITTLSTLKYLKNKSRTDLTNCNHSRITQIMKCTGTFPLFCWCIYHTKQSRCEQTWYYSVENGPTDAYRVRFCSLRVNLLLPFHWKKWLDRNPIRETYLKQQWGNGQARPMEGEGAFVVALPLLSGVKIMIGNSSILLALSIHGPFIAMSWARHVK